MVFGESGKRPPQLQPCMTNWMSPGEVSCSSWKHNCSRRDSSQQPPMLPRIFNSEHGPRCRVPSATKLEGESLRCFFWGAVFRCENTPEKTESRALKWVIKAGFALGYGSNEGNLGDPWSFLVSQKAAVEVAANGQQ